MTSSIPFTDRDDLLAWVVSNLDAVPPLALERLLAHHGFEEAGTMPTTGSARCVVWAYQGRDLPPAEAAAFRFLVYHTDVVASPRVGNALQMIAALRMAITRRRRNP